MNKILSKPFSLILIIVLIWGVSWRLIDCFILDSAERGQFGDKFGAINALFTGIALALVGQQIYLQRKEQEDQSNERENDVKKHNTLLSIEIHRSFQQEFHDIQKMLPPEVNVKGWKPEKDEHKRAITLYWYLVFDEWFICSKRSDGILSYLWTEYYSNGVKSALKIDAFRDAIEPRLAKKYSFLGQREEFYIEINRILDIANHEIELENNKD
jgi:hypothetical protein